MNQYETQFSLAGSTFSCPSFRHVVLSHDTITFPNFGGQIIIPFRERAE